MGMTPREFAGVARAHFARLQFSWFIRDNGVELDGDTAKENIEIFRKALSKAPKKNAELIKLLEAVEQDGSASSLFKAEKEIRKEQKKKREDTETTLADIKEGKEYIYKGRQGLEMATVVSCDSCGRFFGVNSVHVSGYNLRPVKVLEGLGELAGYNEETHRAECEDCYGANYKTKEEALAGIAKQKKEAKKKKRA